VFVKGIILIAALFFWMYAVDANILVTKPGETRSILELIWQPSVLLVASSASHAFSWTKLIEWQGSTGWLVYCKFFVI
jgi:hypothetical protein